MLSASPKVHLQMIFPTYSARQLEVTNEASENFEEGSVSSDAVESDETSSDDDADEETDELDNDGDDIFEGIVSFYYLNFRRQIKMYHISQILQCGKRLKKVKMHQSLYQQVS